MHVLRGHWQLLLLTAGLFALWQTPVAIPLKILVVFLHEASHALMTWATGGEVVSLTISPSQGGEVWSRGGNPFLTLSHGYLGSLLIGVGLLLLALRTALDRIVVAGFGLAMVVIAVLLIRDLYALFFTMGVGVLLLLAARYLSLRSNDLILRIIGLSSMIYVPFDIFSDTIARSQLPSDARMLAEEFGGATVIWGGFWLLVSLATISWCVLRGLGTNSNLWRQGPRV